MSTSESDVEDEDQSSMTDESLDLVKFDSSNMPSQAPTPRVGPNKILELVQDNHELRKLMSEMSNQLKGKCVQLDAFYKKLKDSSRTMRAAYAQAQVRIQEQQNKIAFLQSEKVQLKREIMTSSPRCVAIHEAHDMNGNEKAEDDYKAELNDTVAMLTQQLKVSQYEKLDLERKARETEDFLKQKWMEREDDINAWNRQQAQLYEQLKERNQELVSTLQQKQEEFDQQEKMYQQQFVLLSEENKKYSLDLKAADSQLVQSKSLAENKEETIFQLTKDTKVMEEQVAKMTDDIIYLKQSLEETQRQHGEKVESLDQLFKVYHEEREQNEQLEKKSKGLAEELDKVLAQYLCAEESLKRKNEEIGTLKDRLREANPETQMSVYKHLAEIYKKDFEVETAERKKTQQHCDSLQTMLGQYQMEMQRMKQELMKYQHQQFQQMPGGYGA